MVAFVGHTSFLLWGSIASYALSKFIMPLHLRSQEGSDDPLNDDACGLFIHPSIGEDVNEYVVIQNHRI